MAETRHRTVLEIGVDDREVRGLGATMDQAFSPKTVEAFERSLERTSRTLAKLIEQQTRLTGVLDRMDQQGRQQSASQRSQQGGGGRGGGRGGGGGATFMGAAAGSYLGNLGGTAMQGSGAVATAMSAIPLIGPILSGAVQGVQTFYQSHVQRVLARSGAFGATGVGHRGYGTFEGQAAGLGVNPAAASGMLSQYANQTGMKGPDLLGAAPGLLRMQQVMGFGNLGSVLGGAGTAGGQGSFDAIDVMGNAVRSGVVSGFREGKLDQFFSQFGGWLGQMRTGGIQIDAGSALQLLRGTSGLGASFQGEAGLAAAQGFQGAVTGAGRQTGPAALMMLRAAGMRGGSYGTRSFMEARAHAEQNPAEVMRNFMEIFRRAAGSTEPGQAALFAEQAMQSLGMQMTATQSLDFANAALSGQGGGFVKDNMMAGRGAAGNMIGNRAARGAGVLGAAATESQYELSRANLGANVSGAAIAIRNLEMTLAQSFLPAMGSFTGFINKAAAHIRSGDWAGLAMHVAESGNPIGDRGLNPSDGGAIYDASRDAASQMRQFLADNPSLRTVIGTSAGGRAMLEGLDSLGVDSEGRPANSSPHSRQRGLGPGSEAQQREMERLQGEDASPGEVQERLNQMQGGNDPISRIERGGHLVVEGARALRDGMAPAENEVV